MPALTLAGAMVVSSGLGTGQIKAKETDKVVKEEVFKNIHKNYIVITMQEKSNYREIEMKGCFQRRYVDDYSQLNTNKRKGYGYEKD